MDGADFQFASPAKLLDSQISLEHLAVWLATCTSEKAKTPAPPPPSAESGRPQHGDDPQMGMSSGQWSRGGLALRHAVALPCSDIVSVKKKQSQLRHSSEAHVH